MSIYTNVSDLLPSARAWKCPANVNTCFCLHWSQHPESFTPFLIHPPFSKALGQTLREQQWIRQTHSLSLWGSSSSPWHFVTCLFAPPPKQTGPNLRHISHCPLAMYFLQVKAERFLTSRGSLLLFFCLLGAVPATYSQARDRIRAAAASLHHSHSNARSKPHLQSTPQLTATSGP